VTQEPSHWSHDPHPHDDYQNVHNRYMESLEDEGLVLGNHLVFTEIKYKRKLIEVHLAGRIECLAGITIEVDKWLDVTFDNQGRPYVKGHHIATMLGEELSRQDT
jgi:hypothetical protein